MATPFLCEDILMEIFLRLPAKSVGKFRCLSKTWSTNLSTSRFVKLHLITTRKAKKEKLFLRMNYASLHVLTLAMEDERANALVKLPIAPRGKVVNSCNGLVLLRHDNFEMGFDMSLVNPITMEHVIVPIPSGFKPMSFVSVFNCGLGYDHSSDDHKVVICYWIGVDPSAIIQVYSVKSKVWKRVNTNSPDHLITHRSRQKGVFTNGAIHWIYYDSMILAFNLADEVFYDIPFPTASADGYYRVHVIEGCLCVVDKSNSLKKNIWIMKEYGGRKPWTHYIVDSKGNGEKYRPLCFIGDEEIAVLTSSMVIVQNLVEGQKRDLIVDGNTNFVTDGIAFFDSLVSPNQHDFYS